MKVERKSNCCLADVSIGGNGITHYHVCERCKQSCDGVLAEHVVDFLKSSTSMRIEIVQTLREAISDGKDFSMVFDILGLWSDRPKSEIRISTTDGIIFCDSSIGWSRMQYKQLQA
jgi:hypothetical protein